MIPIDTPTPSRHLDGLGHRSLGAVLTGAGGASLHKGSPCCSLTQDVLLGGVRVADHIRLAAQPGRPARPSKRDLLAGCLRRVRYLFA
jgi:hypothetical protein